MSSSDVPVVDLHLKGVPGEVGGEVSYKVQSDGSVHVHCRVLPAGDLNIRGPLDVTFVVPPGYPGNNESGTTIRVRTSLPEGTFPATFPWLMGTSYPLSVWFYTARNALKRSTTELMLLPHSTPVPLRANFPYSPPAPSATHNPTSAQPRRCGITIVTASGRTRGKRPYMEDVDFSYPALRVSEYHKQVCVIGVLDGHGGSECAQFVADEIPAKLSGLLKAQPARNCDMALVLHQAFLQVDAEYLASSGSNAGSTACVILWDGGEGNETCFIANTGDTRAVLCRGGAAIDLTIDRKASDPEEVARIAQLGGFVHNGRVHGSLAVSRALGDSDLKLGRGRFAVKKADGSKQLGVQGALIADPEVTTFHPQRPPRGGPKGHVDGTSRVQSSSGGGGEVDEYIILATDGLWDVVSSQAACDAVSRRLQQAGKSLDTLSEADLAKLCDGLAAEAVSLGSQDNVTVRMVVFRGEGFGAGVRVEVGAGGAGSRPSSTGSGSGGGGSEGVFRPQHSERASVDPRDRDRSDRSDGRDGSLADRSLGSGVYGQLKASDRGSSGSLGSTASGSSTGSFSSGGGGSGSHSSRSLGTVGTSRYAPDRLGGGGDRSPVGSGRSGASGLLPLSGAGKADRSEKGDKRAGRKEDDDDLLSFLLDDLNFEKKT